MERPNTGNKVNKDQNLGPRRLLERFKSNEDCEGKCAQDKQIEEFEEEAAEIVEQQLVINLEYYTQPVINQK